MSAGRPPVLSTAEAGGIVTAVVIITMIIAVVGYLFLHNRRYVTTKHSKRIEKWQIHASSWLAEQKIIIF